MVTCKYVYIDTLYTGIYIYISYKYVHVHIYKYVLSSVIGIGLIFLVTLHTPWVWINQVGVEHMPSFCQVIQQLHPFFSLDRWSRLTSRSQLFKVSLDLSKNGSRQDLPNILGFAQAAWKISTQAQIVQYFSW